MFDCLHIHSELAEKTNLSVCNISASILVPSIPSCPFSVTSSSALPKTISTHTRQQQKDICRYSFYLSIYPKETLSVNVLQLLQSNV